MWDVVPQRATLSHMERAESGTRKVHRSYRLPADTAERLTERARRHRTAETSLVERYIDEGLRQDAHPGIGFRDGAAGRRACLPGTRLDVWMIIETWLAEDRSISATAEYFEVGQAQIRAAVGYYAAHQAEIDEWIEENQHASDEWRDEIERLGIRAG